MAEIHKRAITGDIVSDFEAEELVDRHLNAPSPTPSSASSCGRLRSRQSPATSTRTAPSCHSTLYSEQQVQVHVAPGITVDGRIDLIRRLDTNETSIVDFKSTERAQADDITLDQLHVYVVGYEELTGERADLVEVLNLDKKSDSQREVVNDAAALGHPHQDPARRRRPARQPPASPALVVPDLRPLRSCWSLPDASSRLREENGQHT